MQAIDDIWICKIWKSCISNAWLVCCNHMRDKFIALHLSQSNYLEEQSLLQWVMICGYKQHNTCMWFIRCIYCIQPHKTCQNAGSLFVDVNYWTRNTQRTGCHSFLQRQCRHMLSSHHTYLNFPLLPPLLCHLNHTPNNWWMPTSAKLQLASRIDPLPLLKLDPNLIPPMTSKCNL